MLLGFNPDPQYCYIFPTFSSTQVRDVLKGVLKPASIFNLEEIDIREDHYVQNIESPARVRMQPRTGNKDYYLQHLYSALI